MASYAADFYIDSKTLDWATREECPSIFNEYIADILIDALGINGSANVFCKCKYGGYNLSWVLKNGNEYVQTFSEEELLGALQGKVVDYELKIRKETQQAAYDEHQEQPNEDYYECVNDYLDGTMNV